MLFFKIRRNSRDPKISMLLNFILTLQWLTAVARFGILDVFHLSAQDIRNYFLVPLSNEKNLIYPSDRKQNTKLFVVELPLCTRVSRDLDLDFL